MNAIRLAAAAAPLLLVGCITDPVTGKSVWGMPTSETEEEALGDQYRPTILQQFSGAYPDAELQSYLSGIVLGMAKKSVRPDVGWTFTVVNSSDVNAFAVPGGELFITRGLLWRLDDEAEFAVVMGHEIGHVEHRHVEQAQFRDTASAALIGLAADKIGLGEQGANLITPLVLARFSRDQERESDVRGVEHSYAAGYDPRRGAEVFRKFLALKQERGGGGGMDAWTSDHPLDEERIETIQRLSAEKDPRLKGAAPVSGLKVQTGRFAELSAKFRGQQKVYERHDVAMARLAQAGGSKDAAKAAVAEFEGFAKDLPGHAFLASSAGKVAFLAGDAAGARRWWQKAEGMNQGLLEPEYGLALVSFREKKYDDAVVHADRGLALLPDNYACLYVHGEANFARGRTEDANADFQAVLQNAPKESDEYKGAAARLGVAAQPTK